MDTKTEIKLEVRKVVIPVAGFGTRFLPLTRVLPKGILPVVDEPMAAYSIREAKNSGITDVVMVVSDNMKIILDYFKPKNKLENILERRGSFELLERLKQVDKEFEEMSFSSVVQPIPTGDGDAVLKSKKYTRKDSFGVLFHDDLFFGGPPAISQLIKVFQTAQKPVIGLKKLDASKISKYGAVAVEKVAHRLYKIKKIIEKPKPGEAPSDLACCGRYVLTPDVFSYLEKTPLNAKGELILAEMFKEMINDGKVIYGYEIEGEWLECGQTIDWLKSNLFLTLQHKEYGPIIKEYLKNICKR
ncbi:MAG: sugar phosphate nucleotidyltransferase [Candidatus Pacebacteria bacterium]|nr:sugar phosphate nucleotidyltransferase [Candidatus Paceibacterota bacterium]